MVSNYVDLAKTMAENCSEQKDKSVVWDDFYIFIYLSYLIFNNTLGYNHIYF